MSSFDPIDPDYDMDTDDTNIAYDEIAEMIEDYGFSFPVISLYTECDFDADNPEY